MLSGFACFAPLRAFKSVLPTSLSLKSRLWLRADRVTRFGGVWVPARAVGGAGWGVVRRLPALVEVRSAIVEAEKVLCSGYCPHSCQSPPSVENRPDTSKYCKFR